MPKYSRGHEREECAKMWKGFWHSTFGILFCWVPLLGLIFSISGFARQVVRMTDKYKKRMALFIVYGLLSLVITIGAMVGGLYAYAHDPDVFHKAATQAWKMLTGQETLPGETPITDYSGMENPGLGGSMGSGETDALDQTEEPDVEDEINPDEDVEADNVPDNAEGAVDDGTDSSYVADDDEQDDLPELDFDYSEEDSEEYEVAGVSGCMYKVMVSIEEMTDLQLKNLFLDVTYEDGYDLHKVLVYKPDSDVVANYDIAMLEQTAAKAEPTITRAAKG